MPGSFIRVPNAVPVATELLPFTKMAICSKRDYRGWREQQGVGGKMLDADNCSSSPDFSTKQHMSLTLPEVVSLSL